LVCFRRGFARVPFAVSNPVTWHSEKYNGEKRPRWGGGRGTFVNVVGRLIGPDDTRLEWKNRSRKSLLGLICEKKKKKRHRKNKKGGGKVAEKLHYHF